MSIQDIVNLPMDEFNDLLSKRELTEEQLNLCRDIRRRGKNKVLNDDHDDCDVDKQGKDDDGDHDDDEDDDDGYQEAWQEQGDQRC